VAAATPPRLHPALLTHSLHASEGVRGGGVRGNGARGDNVCGDGAHGDDARRGGAHATTRVEAVAWR
jgi:hypothetical protein